MTHGDSKAGVGILIVEDDAALRRLFGLVVGGAGYRVMVASSPHRALEMWESGTRDVQLVITDVVMPGISCRQLVEQLRARDPDVPIICVSGLSGDELAGRGALPEGVVCLQKPVVNRVLLREVRRLLRVER